MTERLGRADLHIHTLASDGTAGVVEILDHVERNTELDVIAITDHERIDAALAGREMARDRGLSFEVVVGEEVTTLGGHLLALWIETKIKPFRSMRSTIAEIHDQGGLAIPAHPLVPYPLCAQGFVLRRLLADEPRYRPDAIEAFNPTTLGRPWHGRVVRFADEHHLARVGNSDAHALDRRSAPATRPSRATTATRFGPPSPRRPRITTGPSTRRARSSGRSVSSSASTAATRGRTWAAACAAMGPAATWATRGTAAALAGDRAALLAERRPGKDVA